jgi:hypothetical protein
MKDMFLMLVAGCIVLAIDMGIPGADAAHIPTMKDLEAIPRLTKEELKPMLGNQNVIIIDVRINQHWGASKEKIVGAFRESPTKDIRTWAGKYPKNKIIVLY